MSHVFICLSYLKYRSLDDTIYYNAITYWYSAINSLIINRKLFKMSLKIKSTKVRGICEKRDDMENKTNDKSTTVEIKKRKKDNSYKNRRLHQVNR